MPSSHRRVVAPSSSSTSTSPCSAASPSPSLLTTSNCSSVTVTPSPTTVSPTPMATSAPTFGIVPLQRSTSPAQPPPGATPTTLPPCSQLSSATAAVPSLVSSHPPLPPPRTGGPLSVPVVTGIRLRPFRSSKSTPGGDMYDASHVDSEVLMCVLRMAIRHGGAGSGGGGGGPSTLPTGGGGRPGFFNSNAGSGGGSRPPRPCSSPTYTDFSDCIFLDVLLHLVRVAPDQMITTELISVGWLCCVCVLYCVSCALVPTCVRVCPVLALAAALSRGARF